MPFTVDAGNFVGRGGAEGGGARVWIPEIGIDGEAVHSLSLFL